MLSITAFAGTQRVSGLRLIRDLETMGAQISSSADREKVQASLLSFFHHCCNYTQIGPICSPRLVTSV